jgi:hypothetical protein
MIHLALTTALLFAQPPEGAALAPGGNDSAIAASAAVASETKSAAPESQAAAPESKPAPSQDELLHRIEALEAMQAERASADGKLDRSDLHPESLQPGSFHHRGLRPRGYESQRRNGRNADGSGIHRPVGPHRKLRGINFNYLELAFAAAVDPYFDFFSVVTFAPGGFDIEETYVDTRQLPFGFQLRIGKFLSAFGRQNGMHAHVWDFYDQPLVYEAFMGGEGWKNPGVRLSWTAPVDFLLQLNLEVFQGVNDQSPIFNATGYSLTAQNGAEPLRPRRRSFRAWLSARSRRRSISATTSSCLGRP